MFMNEVPNSADLPALIVNELRDIYGIKYRKDKKHKNAQVRGSCQPLFAQNNNLYRNSIGNCVD